GGGRRKAAGFVFWRGANSRVTTRHPVIIQSRIESSVHPRERADRFEPGFGPNTRHARNSSASAVRSLILNPQPRAKTANQFGSEDSGSERPSFTDLGMDRIDRRGAAVWTGGRPGSNRGTSRYEEANSRSRHG